MRRAWLASWRRQQDATRAFLDGVLPDATAEDALPLMERMELNAFVWALHFHGRN